MTKGLQTLFNFDENYMNQFLMARDKRQTVNGG